MKIISTRPLYFGAFALFAAFFLGGCLGVGGGNAPSLSSQQDAPGDLLPILPLPIDVEDTGAYGDDKAEGRKNLASAIGIGSTTQSSRNINGVILDNVSMDTSSGTLAIINNATDGNGWRWGAFTALSTLIYYRHILRPGCCESYLYTERRFINRLIGFAQDGGGNSRWKAREWKARLLSDDLRWYIPPSGGLRGRVKWFDANGERVGNPVGDFGYYDNSFGHLSNQTGHFVRFHSQMGYSQMMSEAIAIPSNAKYGYVYGSWSREDGFGVFSDSMSLAALPAGGRAIYTGGWEGWSYPSGGNSDPLLALILGGYSRGDILLDVNWDAGGNNVAVGATVRHSFHGLSWGGEIQEYTLSANWDSDKQVFYKTYNESDCADAGFNCRGAEDGGFAFTWGGQFVQTADNQDTPGHAVGTFAYHGLISSVHIFRDGSTVTLSYDGLGFFELRKNEPSLPFTCAKSAVIAPRGSCSYHFGGKDYTLSVELGWLVAQQGSMAVTFSGAQTYTVKRELDSSGIIGDYPGEAYYEGLLASRDGWGGWSLQLLPIYPTPAQLKSVFSVYSQRWHRYRSDRSEVEGVFAFTTLTIGIQVGENASSSLPIGNPLQYDLATIDVGTLGVGSFTLAPPITLPPPLVVGVASLSSTSSSPPRMSVFQSTLLGYSKLDGFIVTVVGGEYVTGFWREEDGSGGYFTRLPTLPADLPNNGIMATYEGVASGFEDNTAGDINLTVSFGAGSAITASGGMSGDGPLGSTLNFVLAEATWNSSEKSFVGGGIGGCATTSAVSFTCEVNGDSSKWIGSFFDLAEGRLSTEVPDGMAGNHHIDFVLFSEDNRAIFSSVNGAFLATQPAP